MNDLCVSGKSPGRPRLWVETLWLLDSLQEEKPLREIPLCKGLNLIVSPPSKRSSGHGVGKTAFCQLLRFVLDDPLWSEGSLLRDELLINSTLREGAVAAKVHLGNEVWTVLKTWQPNVAQRASRKAAWRQLAINEAENEFEAYQSALQWHFVNVLPIQNLPGSQQIIKWHHILAWCSRDQNARYQNYYQWRAGGVGFNLPAQSPLTLMQIVLGLVHDVSTQQELSSVNKVIEELKSELQTLREEPQRLLHYIHRQLNRQLNCSLELVYDASLTKSDLFENKKLSDMVKKRQEEYKEELEKILTEQRQLLNTQQECLERRQPVKNAIEILSNRIEQIKAGIAGDLCLLEKLKNEGASLQQRSMTRCEAGNLLLQNCHYVRDRINSISIESKRRMVANQDAQKKLENELLLLSSRLDELKDELKPIDDTLAEINQQNTELDNKRVQLLLNSQYLTEAVKDYDFYEDVIAGKSEWESIKEVEGKLQKNQRDQERLNIQNIKERDVVNERREAISNTMHEVAKAISGFNWGIFNDDEQNQKRPFRMGPSSSTTYKVLEILAGDVACLLDCSSEESFHPGFLLHDSPREAEMNENLLWELLNHVVANGNNAYQYIVTTSTEPPESLKKYIRLKLSADNQENYLFKNYISQMQKNLPLIS